MGDVLYLDQPIGTGFSFGANDTDLLTSMDQVTEEFVNFIDSFVTMYPEYKSPKKIILMGESAAAKFMGPFAKGLDQYVEKGGKIQL
jgi:carboxypeptidase C (cathepsin A)